MKYNNLNTLLQVEVYQSDFNAERQAREKIAGEKADLVEEIRRIKNSQLSASPIMKEVQLSLSSRINI